MRTAIVTVTRDGTLLGQRIAGILRKFANYQVDLFVPARYAELCPGSIPYEKPLASVMKNIFYERQAIVMVMALGIVIRMIAPYLQSKLTDPAVVVLDEKGQHVISALSGHLGGANRLTTRLASELGACPVITTATDVQNRPAIDLLAQEYDLIPEPPTMVTGVNAALVNGDQVTVYTENRLNLQSMPGFTITSWKYFNSQSPIGNDRQVLITNRIISGLINTLFLRPRNLIVGIGCRKGTPKKQIEEVMKQVLEQTAKSIYSIKYIATVDLRADEPGLTALAADLKIPLLVFSREEIRQAYERYPGTFQQSDFVQEKIGVGGVCEPVPLLACPQAKLISPKTRQNGVTIAIAEDGWQWSDSVPEVLNT